MHHPLPYSRALVKLLPLALAVFLLMPERASAQLTAGDGFSVAWELDPRDYPTLFARGLALETPAFGARSVLVGMDFDGDGNKEILFSTDETLAPGGPDPGVLDIFLFEATGDDTYEYVWHYSHPEGSNSLPALAYGDIDDDGSWEIYFGIPTINDDPEDLFIFEQEDGVFPTEPTVSYQYRADGSLDFRPAGFQIADVDNDGKKELLTVSRTSNARELVVLELVGNDLNSFALFENEFEAGNDILGGGGVYDLDVVDFDNDGNMEIWVSTWDKLSMTIWEATAEDTYTLQVDLTALDPDVDHGSFNTHDLLFYDIDNDGNVEFYWPTTSGTLYFVDDVDDVANLSGTDFNAIGVFDATGRSRGADLGDIDGDGNLDIVAGHGTSEKVSRIEYNGIGAPTDSTSYEWTIILDSAGGEEDPVERYYPLRIADDLDGDGRNEVVITNVYASSEGQPMIVVLEVDDAQTANERDGELPDAYTLRQNFPNPFNPTTTIAYNLPAADRVTLKVYNVMGQLVRTLVGQELQEAGEHNVTWNGRTDAGALVSSGAYLYVLEHSNGRQTRVMTLLK